jgi:hypothetical protein
MWETTIVWSGFLFSLFDPKSFAHIGVIKLEVCLMDGDFHADKSFDSLEMVGRAFAGQ